MLERNEQMRLREAKVARARDRGEIAYPNDFKPTMTCAAAYTWFLAPDAHGVPVPERLRPFSPLESAPAIGGDAPDAKQVRLVAPRVRLAGRVMAVNVKGKVAFLRIKDRSAIEVVEQRVAENAIRERQGLPVRPTDATTFQLYLQHDEDPALFERVTASEDAVDIGDIVGAEGLLFRTRTGEPSLWLKRSSPDGTAALRILTKALRPLPEKWHGLTDKETRFRQRYVDLLSNDDVRLIFKRRSQIIRAVRDFFDEREFVEVETPMMHAIAGGAAARPFVTHHNAQNMPLYLRIAPELYLKRLVVGGIERVYEINRNFRNEGMDQRHNPEFTMLEFYEAYATYDDLMERVEQLIGFTCDRVLGTRRLTFGKHPDGTPRELSLEAPFRRISIREGLKTWGGLDDATIDSRAAMLAEARRRGLEVKETTGLGKLQQEVFEHAAEPHLFRPTFVTAFPAEVSPLSRRNDGDPTRVDRFELYIGGFEVTNAFSELNDPVDQFERFEAQVKERAAGDDEAMPMDVDYVRALEYGMPPTAGCGVGIDRLTMLLTDTESIREVILFPLMRPEV